MGLSPKQEADKAVDDAVLKAIAPEKGYDRSDSAARHIAEKTGYDKGTTYKSLQRLKEAGAIEWTRAEDWIIKGAVSTDKKEERSAKDLIHEALQEKPRMSNDLQEISGVTNERVRQILNELRDDGLVERSDEFVDGPGGGFSWSATSSLAPTDEEKRVLEKYFPPLVHIEVQSEEEEYEKEILLEPWRGFSKMTVKESRDFLRQIVLDFDYSESLRYLLSMVWAWDQENKQSTYLRGDLTSYSEEMRLRTLEEKGCFASAIRDKRSSNSPFAQIGEELRFRWYEYTTPELQKMVMSFTNGKDEFIDNMSRQAYYEINRRIVAPA